MAFDFPSSPTPGTVYTPAGGPSYTYDGAAWKLRAPSDALINAVGWRFEQVSTTLCRLMPYNGSGIRINGVVYPIPAAGVSFSNSGLGLNGMWDVYAYINSSGAITLEGVVVATGHSRDTTPGNVGTEIKNGDPSRSLVGKVWVNASGVFQMDDTVCSVRSWMNRGNVALYTPTLGANTAVPASVADLTNLLIRFVAFAGDTLTFTGIMSWFSNTASALTYSLRFNGTTYGYGLAINTDTSGRVTPATLTFGSNLVSDGFYTLTVGHVANPIGPTSYTACYATAVLME